jgi:hypothetical protein
MGVIDGRTWKHLTSVCPDLPDRLRAEIKPRQHAIGGEDMPLFLSMPSIPNAGQILTTDGAGGMYWRGDGTWASIGESEVSKITKFLKFKDDLIPLANIGHAKIFRADKEKDEHMRPSVTLMFCNGASIAEFFNTVEEAETRFSEVQAMLNEAVSEYHERNSGACE